MDANGTRHHLLLGDDDWAKIVPTPGSPGSRTEWDGDREELTLESRVFAFPPPRHERPPALDDRRGADRDRFGNWYWVDGPRSGVEVQSVGSGATSQFWTSLDPQACPRALRPDDFHDLESPPSPQPLVLAGAAVTTDHFLVVGITSPPGLLVFDLAAGGPPRHAVWPSEVDFEPFDLARRPDGGAYLIDRAHQRLWEIDRTFAVVSRAPAPTEEAGGFRPVEGGSNLPATPAPRRARIRIDDAVELGGDPISVDVGADGTLYLLDRGDGTAPHRVRRFRDGVETGEPILLADEELGLELLAHDLAVGPDGLYVVERAGNQAYRFSLAGKLVRSYFPMRGFAGKALVSTPDGPSYDFGDTWVPLLEQKRPRHEQEATFETPVFDGREPGCVWHRVFVDACIPPGTDVLVESRAADEAADVQAATWVVEPRPRARRAAESPFPPRLPDGYATHELLLQGAKGRFAQLRITLTGDGRATPRLRALRLSYPRFSYLDRFLPKLYREDLDSASFLDRYLANVEGINTEIEDRIASAQMLFDTRTAPADALDWLAGWYDVALDPAWTEDRRRVFIRNATTFFGWRGTVRGLEAALRLALDTCAGDDVFEWPQPRHRQVVRIVETFRTRRTPSVVFGDPTSGVRVVAESATWRPDDGGDVLSRRWAETAAQPPGTRYPLTPPAGLGPVWTAFSRQTLGFVPSAGPADDDRWRSFLAHRYGGVDRFAAAYGLTISEAPASYAAVSVPERLPPDGVALRDWFQFESVVLPMRRAAHRFTVLLPVPLAEEGEVEAQHEQRRRLVARIVDLQKPAHTVYDIRFYWSAFRVGEARLGEDTILDEGSRSPRLLAAAVLGRAHVGETVLAGPPAPRLRPGPSVGRDRLTP